MINLIPPDARKQVQHEYWVRVISVWIMLLSAACIVVDTLLMPSLFLVRSELGLYKEPYAEAKIENNTYDALEKEVHTANAVAAKLLTVRSNVLFTDIMQQLIETAAGQVSLSSASFARADSGHVETIQIAGTASSRETLDRFRDTLEANDFFESAAVPLSNLAKDVDVPFNITIVVNSAIYK